MYILIHNKGEISLTDTKKITSNKADKLFIMDCLFIVLMLAAVLFSIWKCRYGFGGNDEAFYLDTPHRLTLGDALIKDEWNLSQLSSFLLLPFTWLYTTITGGTAGILLVARFAYILIHCIVSVFIYIRLRKFGYTALAASVLFFVYTPYDIMALSYNTMGLDLVAVTGVLMATTSYQKKLPLIISGLTFAGAVLCNPYLLMAYVIFAGCMVINLIVKKLKKVNNIFAGDYFSFKTFLWFTVGAGILAALFLAFFFTRADISHIQTNLPYMLSDPEHPGIPILTRLNFYFTTIWNAANLFNVSIIAYAVVLLAMIIDRKRRPHRVFYLTATCAIVLFAYCCLFEKLVDYNYNAIMFPFIYLGITSYILTENKNRNLLVCLFSLGIIYSFVLCLSSNQYFYITSMAMASTNIASFIFTGILIREIRAEKYDENQKKVEMFAFGSNDKTTSYSYAPKKIFSAVAFVCTALVILCQGCMQLTVKANHVFWDYNVSYLNTQLTGGPADGIITNQANAKTYQSILSDINQLYGNKKGENLLFLTAKTWTYLAAEDMNYATFSGWLSGENDTAVTRLNQYYTINPQKTPEYIYIPKESKWNFTNLTADANAKGYTVKETNAGYSLEKQK